MAFWEDNFEGSGPNLGGGDRSAGAHADQDNGTGPTVLVGDDFGDYFYRTNVNLDTDVGQNVTFTGIQGSSYWRAEDVEDSAGQAGNPALGVLDWTGIDITGQTGITFDGLFAARLGGATFETTDFITIEYQIDGGAYTTGMVLRGNSFDGGMYHDANNNNVNDGEVSLSEALTNFSFNVVGTGANLNLRLTTNVGANEEIAFDNVSLTCFAPGTLIATPDGERAVETLEINDMVSTADGRQVPVRWLGRQSVRTRPFPERLAPVRIATGALGGGLPHSDLTVTADHAMVAGELLINASALVNGETIRFLCDKEVPEILTVYHIETDAHEVLLAHGCATESFLDAGGRSDFDNQAEYLELYGVERIIPEMDRPRISSRRLLPDAIKARLGISESELDFDSLMVA